MPKLKLLRAPVNLESRIHLIRGQKVILDLDLAEVYGVKTMVLNQTVKRNAARFPPRFMFRLTDAEKQEVITNCDYLSRLKFSPVTPLAFTEHGIIMAATLLNSRRAIKMSVHLVDAFLRMRQLLGTSGELAVKLAEMERRLTTNETDVRELFAMLKQLLAPPPEPVKTPGEIGFHVHMAKPAPSPAPPEKPAAPKRRRRGGHKL